MVLIQSLRAAGYDPYFYDIDCLRPKFEEVVRFFEDKKPDFVGISAVVSTAYAYTKRLTAAIRKVSPHTKIVVGGNLAASSEMLLRLCEVDVCAIGEGEKVIVNLTKHWESQNERSGSYSELKHIKGISYLDEDSNMIFTGYDTAIPASEFLDPDFSILEQFSDIDQYINDPLHRYDFANDPRSYEPHRLGKKLAVINSAKGCVARCTFCHRWDRGYRHWDVDRIIENIQHLMDQYNVGFLAFGDENFGSDRKKLDYLIERLATLDILYKVGGVRVASVDLDLLHRMKKSGCVGMYYGIESGSPDILQIMEKNASLEQNINAAKWTYEAGLYTVYQLVLGMPGENHKTIAQTAEFLKQVTEFLPGPPSKRLSINYIQALPGTPIYEYARNIGEIGSTLEDEERYLMQISDTNAADDTKFLNFTEYDYFTVQSWRPRIVFDVEAHWYRNRGWKSVNTERSVSSVNVELPESEADEDYSRGGYFNLGHTFFIRHPLFYRTLSNPLGYPFRVVYPAAYVLAKDLKKLPKKLMLKYIWQFFSFKIKGRRSFKENRSLRRVMKDRAVPPSTVSEESMQPLRDGR